MMSSSLARTNVLAALVVAGLSMLGVEPAQAQGSGAQTASGQTAFSQTTAGLDRRSGLLPVWLDARKARVLIAFSPDSAGDCGEYLYQVYMRSGLGSTPVGIDRSNPGETHILAFRRVGGRVMAELENTDFRADLGGPAEKAAVKDSFPPSIIWSGDILAEQGGTILVDVSGFLTRDAFGVVDALKRAGQGDFTVAPDRSYPDLADIQTFPDNLEFEAHQTFVSAAPGDEVKTLAPNAHSVTLIEHQSLIRLPDPGFVPRPADPRTGTFDQLIADYGAPLTEPVVRRLATRFRLQKTDPSAPRSTVKRPIVFYVDRAAPEPVRVALAEGARWWADAFDRAGFIDAFRVEVLPEGVSPLDARYNVINWVHRQTRGWSYGFPIVDPRTGEIVKGAVLLGSLRARQDLMIFEGLEGAAGAGKGGPNDPLVIALARLRQLAVHETGHALGLAHNFAGSTYGDRASVMDYPPPRVGIVGGRLDFSDAYKVGLGDWDRFAISWLYGEFPGGAAGGEALESIVRNGYAQGLSYVRDEDARPTSSPHPRGALWDDGPDPVVALAHVLDVRRIALAGFGPGNLPAGAPLSDLRRMIVPVYLFHRYETDSVAKSIGGVDFTYAVRGDGAPAARPVDGPSQRRALAALLSTLDPAVLDLPDSLIANLSAGRDGTSDRAFEIEVFGDPRSPIFDIAAAARAATDITLDNLLEPSRLERVADQGARLPGALKLGEMLDQTLGQVFGETPAPPRLAQLRRVVRRRLVVKLAALLDSGQTPAAVKAEVRAALDRLADRLAKRVAGDTADVALDHDLAAMVKTPSLAAAEAKQGPAPPPGMPIGAGNGDDGWFGDPPAAD